MGLTAMVLASGPMPQNCRCGAFRPPAFEATHGRNLRLPIGNDPLRMYAAARPSAAAMGLLARVWRALERTLRDCTAALDPRRADA